MPKGSTARAIALAALALASPALAQGPKSLLPPGVPGAPPAPPPASADPAAPPASTPAAPPPEAAPRAEAPAPRRAAPRVEPAPLPATNLGEASITEPPPPVSRAPTRLGLLDDATGGYGDALWRADDARYLAALLDRVTGPLGSRWMQIVLQRALLTRAEAPVGLNPATWAAARAQALIRMGSAADAHRMLLDVPADRYTVPLFPIAAEAALAAGDPLALCATVATARAVADSQRFELASLYCGSLDGGGAQAAEGFDDARRRRGVTPFDVGLAERIASTAGELRRAATPVPEDVTTLDAWRLGLASAGGVVLPDELVAAATPAQNAWMFRLAGLPSARRAAAAPVAVGTGAAGAAEANRLFAARTLELGPDAPSNNVEARIRAAWSAPDAEDRLEAMRDLLDGQRGVAREGWLAIIGPAAARLTPAELPARDAALVIDSLLAAGLAPRAAEWGRAQSAETRATLAPQLVTLGLEADLAAWTEKAGPARAARAVAALQGLGRGPGGTPPLVNDWTRAMDSALASGRTGRVLLLAASALKLPWEAAPPDHLRRVVAALVAIGRREEALLVAAEAAARR